MGEFKCPIYDLPTDPSIDGELIYSLNKIPNAFIHFRINNYN